MALLPAQSTGVKRNAWMLAPGCPDNIKQLIHPIHLCVTELSSLFARKQLLFRDYLRARPGTAREYGERKAALSRRSSSVSTFTNANSNFINQLMNLAIKGLSALKSK